MLTFFSFTFDCAPDMETKLKITLIMLSMLLSISPVTPAGKIDSRTGALHIPEKIIGGVIDIVQNHKNKPSTNQQVQANFQLQQQQGYQYPTQWSNQLYQNQLQAQYQAQLQAQAQYGSNQPGYPQNQGNFQQHNNNFQQNGGSQFEAQAQFVSQSGSYVGTPVAVGSGYPQNQGHLQTQNQNQFQGTYQNSQTGFPSQPIQGVNHQIPNQGQNHYQSGSQGNQGQNHYQSGSQEQNQYQSSANGGQMSQNQYQQMSNTGNNHEHIPQTSNHPTIHPPHKPPVTPASPGHHGGPTPGPVNPGHNSHQGVSTSGPSHHVTNNQQVAVSQNTHITQGQYQQTNNQGSSGFQVSNGHQVSSGSGGPTCVCQAWSKPPNDDIEEPTTLEDTTVQPDPKKKE